MTISLSGRRILVTGGTGFIGTCLCRRLVHEGADVHAVGRRPAHHVEGIGRRWEADTSRYEAVEELMESIAPNVVLNLASAVTGNRELGQVAPTFASNLMATVNVLIASTRFKCERVVLTGSMEEPRRDDTEPLPPSPYAAAKWASTMYARMFHALYGTPVLVLRLFMVYGPEQSDPTKLIPYVGRSFLRGEAPQLSSGLRPVDWVYVDDVVDAYIRAIEEPQAPGKIIDIGSGKQVTIREVVERLARITGAGVAPVFDALPDRPFEKAPMAKVEDALRILGWRAVTELDEGLRKTVDWLRSEGA